LENFYTNNAERMRNAFSHCKSLENLNLENFDTSKVENMNQMFYNMSNLKTIYVSDKFVTTALS
jgi:surface protein